MALIALFCLQTTVAFAQPLPPLVLSYQDADGQIGTEGLPRPLGLGDRATATGAGDQEAFEQRVLELTNRVRREAGLPPLKLNDTLRDTARAHAQDMAENDFVGHDGSDGSTLGQRLRAAGYTGWLMASENVAAGFSSPEAVVAAWLSSPGHRENLLHPTLRELGMAYAYDANDTYGPYYHYWVQVFSCRRKVYPVIINDEAALTESRQVQLYVYGSGWATEMMVSNWLDFRDASWQEYQPEVAWQLEPGSGERTVYVRLRDKNGRTSDTLDIILLEGSEAGWPTTTPTPSPTATPVPPTPTPVEPTPTAVPPTPTPVPPTATPVPPTPTPVPPTATSVPPTPTPVRPTATPVVPTVTPLLPMPTPTRKATPTPPVLNWDRPWVVINDDAPYTTSPDVTLRLHPAPGTVWMAVSASKDFADATWELFSPTVSWRLERAGTSYVYVKFRAKGDQRFGPYTDSIEYRPKAGE